MVTGNEFIVWLSDVEADDARYVGAKNVKLGELLQDNFPVPNGFIITNHAYREFIRENNLELKIKHLLGTLNFGDTNSLSQVTLLIKRLIATSPIPDTIVYAIFSAYEKLGQNTLVAVRSTVLVPQGKHHPVVGHDCTNLNVKGEASVADVVRRVWASLYAPHVVLYRHEHKLDHFTLGVSLLLQKMIEPEVSGVVYTIDPIKRDKSKMVFEAVLGLGEYRAQGKIVPDYYEVEKKDVSLSYIRVSAQEMKLMRVSGDAREVRVERDLQSKQKITDTDILKLTQFALEIEKRYYFPQEIEWAKSGRSLYILETKPLTNTGVEIVKPIIVSPKSAESMPQHPILIGQAVSPGIGVGRVRIVMSAKDLSKVRAEDILVVPFTSPDYIQAMKKVAGIITDAGEKISHASLVSQELGIPAIVGTISATKMLKDGETVTVNGKTGEVFRGAFGAKRPLTEISSTPFVRTKTRLYVNLSEPELAYGVSKLNVDGVGLLRAEYLIAQMGVHPKKYITDGQGKVFTQKLVDSLEVICKAFYPRPVMYRFTDFKTNEYRNLKGGSQFEPHERNPLIGFRGAARYIHDPQVFIHELAAVRELREKKGYHNLHLMLPFVRTPQELLQVKKIMNTNGVRRSPTLKLFMMVEVPSNVILIDEFIDCGIDGVSIGSNDLTMLLLGTDRDSSEVSFDFDERNAAALWAYERVITAAKKHNISSSICGHAPSQYPDLVDMLVKWGINSISVTPDAVDSTRHAIYNIEKRSGI